jgi:DNA-binding GntR family transcriptional regulator
MPAGTWPSPAAARPPVDLAAHYGVSRSTVTRATLVLAGEGLVRIVPRWGTFVGGERGKPDNPGRRSDD